MQLNILTLKNSRLPLSLELYSGNISERSAHDMAPLWGCLWLLSIVL